MSKFDITLQAGNRTWSVTLEAGSKREASARALRHNRDRLHTVEVIGIVKLPEQKQQRQAMPAHVAAALERGERA